MGMTNNALWNDEVVIPTIELNISVEGLYSELTE